ncbi:MAG: DUF3833 domain-containing protein [Pseudomonadota bacterium]
MRRFFALAFTALLALAVASCAGRPQLDDYTQDGPAFVLERYFDGKIEGWGIFQDRFGDIGRRFYVTIDGTWDGETLTLVEDFVYGDESTERRIWRLRKTGPATWEGEAQGVIGVARGTVSGNAFNFAYEFDLVRPNGETLRVSFDDWMWQQDDRVVINRAYMTKFGIEIGTLSIFFRRAEATGEAAGEAAG